jgi:hypothetical protein
MLDIRLLPNLGEPGEPLLVFLEFLVVEPTEPVREPMETCAEEDECLLRQKLTADGIERSIKINVVMQLYPP